MEGLQQVSKILGEVGVERGCLRLDVKDYRREWVVSSLGFDQERLGQPGFFLGWGRRMPRKAQVVFGRPTRANESVTARTWRDDVWASAKLTWGLAHSVFLPAF